MLLEAHRWTGEEALADGIVDVVAPPEEMLEAATKAKMGLYGVLRHELWGAAAEKMQRVSYVHSRLNSRPALVKP
jgi:enoyl-CoA hydratase/carnithine racemase